MEEELENYMVLITKMDAQLAELPGTRNIEILNTFMICTRQKKSYPFWRENLLICAYDIYKYNRDY